MGAFVKQLDTPADLLVGFRRKWYFLEVKNPEVAKCDRQLTDDEKLFRDLAELHALPYAVVETPMEALKAIGAVTT